MKQATIKTIRDTAINTNGTDTFNIHTSITDYTQDNKVYLTPLDNNKYIHPINAI